MATFIRTMNPYGFKSGQWAHLIDLQYVDDRACYLVRFEHGNPIDWVVDRWVVSDTQGEYEFCEADAKFGFK